MNSVIGELWITALRSGDYRQGVESLRTDRNEYCVLGVLCDVAANQGIVKWVKQGHRFACDGISFYAPEPVLDWAGFDLELSDVEGRIPKIDLIVDMNDNGFSFEEIADYIETNLEVL